jgi:hypothetical protein
MRSPRRQQQEELVHYLRGTEKLYAHFMQHYPGAYNMVVSLTIVTSTPRETFIGHLQKALEIIQKRHPLLHSVIPAPKKEDEKFRYEAVPDSLVPLTVSVSKVLDWSEVHKKEMNTPFEFGQLLYRLHVCCSQDDLSTYFVTGAFCSVFADGASVGYYFSEVLAVLESLNQVKMGLGDKFATETELNSIATLPHPTSGSKVAPKHLVTMNTLESLAINAWQMIESTTSKPKVLFPLKKHVEGIYSNVLSVELGEYQTGAVIQECNKRKLSVTNWIAATILKSLADMHAAKEHLKHYNRHIPLYLARDLRRNPHFKDYPAASFRSLQSGFVIDPKVSDNQDIWQLAQQCKVETNKMIEAMEDLVLYYLFNKRMYKLLRTNKHAFRPVFPVMLASLGVIDYSTGSKTVDSEVNAATLSLHGVIDCVFITAYTSKSKMHFSISYPSRLDEKVVKEWLVAFQKSMETQFKSE